MTAFTGLEMSLRALIVCSRRAADFDVKTDAYQAETDAAERALRRARIQADRLTAGQPKHRKAVRTVRAVVERAAECVDAIRRRSSADRLMRMTDAMQRATERLTELRPELGRQRTQGIDEVVVSQSAWPALPDIFNALGTGQPSEPVEHQRVDQSAAVATLSTSDQDASVAK